MDLQERLLQLKQLMLDIDIRLDSLEQRFTSCADCKGPDSELQVNANAARAPTFVHLSLLRTSHRCICGGQESASCTKARLAKELLERGVTKFRFKRVPEHYYAEELEYRRDCLQAASIQHLCKSLLYENPKLPAEHECQDFRHCLVIVQVRFCCHPCLMMRLDARSTLLIASMCKGRSKDLQHPRPGYHPTFGAA